jgi:hypothetical protein
MFPLENFRAVASNARYVQVGIFHVADGGIVSDGVIPKQLAANSMLNSKRMVKEKRVAPVAQPFLAVYRLAVKPQMRSNIPAAPMPPPMHMVTIP